jgi:hypothetical protein
MFKKNDNHSKIMSNKVTIHKCDFRTHYIHIIPEQDASDISIYVQCTYTFIVLL